MHSIALSIALAGLVAAAPPAPIQHDSRNFKSCNNNPALAVVKILRATAFCSSYLNIKTQTCTRTKSETLTIPQTVSVTKTETENQTATSTNTVVVDDISTVVVPGPTNTVTNTVTDTATITNPVTVTVTKTNTVTQTKFSRSGGPLKRDVLPREPAPNPYARPSVPPRLKLFASKVISTACSCYVPTPTVTVTKTITKTYKPTITITNTNTVSPTVATITNTVTSTNSQTITNTGPAVTDTATVRETVTTTEKPVVTTTKTETVTATVQGKKWNYVANYNANCVPYNYLELEADIGVSSYEEIFQFCANLCNTDSTCRQLWVSYNTPAGAGRYWCLTGGGPEHKEWNANEIQCQYPPIGQYANWYN